MGFKIENGVLMEYTEENGVTDVVIPDSVTSIGYGAFSDCESLTSVTIPDSVTSIGNRAFYWCKSLTSVIIPDGVTSIGDDAFWDTNWLYKKRSENPLVIINGILIDGKSCSGDVIIPDNVTSISNFAFYGCQSLTSVIIPDGVTSISNESFSYCSSIKSITIPDSVTSIGDRAFSYCKSLTSVTIPDGVISIGNWSFKECSSLTSVTIPDSVTSIGNEAFSRCKSLTSITIPDSVTSIGNEAFEDCLSLTSVTIPDSVTSIGDNAFIGTNWLYKKRSENPLVIINGILIDGNSCSGDVIIPDSVIFIGNWAFSFCSSLTSVTIPDSVTSIGDWAFCSCESLTSVTIPDSVTSIGNWAFKECSSLTSIKIKSGDSCMILNDKLIKSDGNLKEDAEKILRFIINEEKEKDTILSELKGSAYKIAVASYLIKKYDDEAAKKYLKRVIKKAVCYYIDNNDAESLTYILPLGYVTKENIDGMIEYAIEKKKLEMQVILTHYKNDNFGFDNGLEKLML